MIKMPSKYLKCGVCNCNFDTNFLFHSCFGKFRKHINDKLVFYPCDGQNVQMSADKIVPLTSFLRENYVKSNLSSTQSMQSHNESKDIGDGQQLSSVNYPAESLIPPLSPPNSHNFELLNNRVNQYPGFKSRVMTKSYELSDTESNDEAEENRSSMLQPRKKCKNNLSNKPHCNNDKDGSNSNSACQTRKIQNNHQSASPVLINHNCDDDNNCDFESAETLKNHYSTSKLIFDDADDPDFQLSEDQHNNDHSELQVLGNTLNHQNITHEAPNEEQVMNKEVANQLLISAVRQHPIIYDVKLSKNKSSYYFQKDLAWKSVARKLEGVFTEESARSKWKILRDQYMKIKLKASKNRQSSGKAAQKRSEWFYFKSLQFLDDFLAEKNQTDSNVNDENIDPQTESTNYFIPTRSGRKTLHTTVMGGFDHLAKVIENSSRCETVTSEHPMINFGNFVGQKLKTYPTEKQNDIMTKIIQVFNDADKNCNNVK